MNTLVMPRLYPVFEAEVTGGRLGGFDFPEVTKLPRNSRFANDLASLHSVAIKPDVEIISAVIKLPKISVNDTIAIVDVAKILGNKTLIPLFSGSKESVNKYRGIYNGVGLRRIVRFLAGATISKSELMELLASILEDALMATYSHLVADGSNIVVVGEDEEFILKTAIAERLPRIYHEEAFVFAADLILDLKKRIGHSGALAIDDGAVFLNVNRLNIVDVGSIPVRFSADGGVHHRKEYDLN